MSERRRGGRKKIDATDDSVSVGVSLPSRQVAAYKRDALREHVSVAEIIRRQLRAVSGQSPAPPRQP